MRNPHEGRLCGLHELRIDQSPLLACNRVIGHAPTPVLAAAEAGGRGRETVANRSPLPDVRHESKHLLVLLLLALLSGLPQIAISLSGVDLAGERLTPVPLTRSLLLDKLPPENPSLTPPEDSSFPPLLATAAAAPPMLVLVERRATDRVVPEPGAWLTTLSRLLYRHNSNFV